MTTTATPAAATGTPTAEATGATTATAASVATAAMTTTATPAGASTPTTGTPAVAVSETATPTATPAPVTVAEVTPSAPGTPATAAARTPLAAVTARPTAESAAGGGYAILAAGFYPYTVLPDESWTIVSGRTGVPIDALQAANPQAIRPSQWLLTNEVLEIPVLPQPGWPRAAVVLYTVQPGDSWNSIGADLQVSPTLLWAVNPALRRWWQVLIAGDEMIIPPAPAWPPGR
ncbi:MAG: LysM peptidoglycan-binding domain-containing protein [Caldilineaceae bacterium]|nr:LysM peptidoglycan-binding domain-containing protein [Caldilineaceae bacterium]